MGNGLTITVGGKARRGVAKLGNGLLGNGLIVAVVTYVAQLLS